MLVPFTEFQPRFSGFVLAPQITNLNVVEGRAPIPKTNSLSVNICYETLFGQIVSNALIESQAGVIAFISSESWTPGAAQLLMKISRLRAIENRKYVVRATNDGQGALITPMGEISQLASNELAVSPLACKIVSNQIQTFYGKHGDLIGRLAIVTLPVLLIIAFLCSALWFPFVSRVGFQNRPGSLR